MASPAWLPPRILLAQFGGDWGRFIEEIYAHFQQDFVAEFDAGQLRFEGTPLSLRRHPMVRGKEASFWHLVTTGDIEEERTPDLRRCERIRWARAVIDNIGDPAIKRWENTRDGNTNICLWLECENYLVVLGKRNNYVLLLTAYVAEEHRKRRLKREYEEFINP